jgi:hypothetical protein
MQVEQEASLHNIDQAGLRKGESPNGTYMLAD